MGLAPPPPPTPVRIAKKVPNKLLDIPPYAWYVETDHTTMSAICKFCKGDFPNHPELRLHCELEHPMQFFAIQKWLDRTTNPRLQTYEKLAAEGMVGAKESLPK